MGAISKGARDVGYRRVVTFAASGNYVKPAGLRRIKVSVVGAGAGAGGVRYDDTGYGGAGAGGGYSSKTIEASALAASEVVTIGAGGPGGAGASSSNGTSGGMSSFGTHCLATGGGAAVAGAPGSPGVGISGDINLWGESPDGGRARGGGSYLAPPGTMPVANVTTNGSNYGGGASSVGSGTTVSTNGGVGAAGFVIVEEFY